MGETHILVVTYPGQGHINPSLQCAKRLTRLGVKTTLLTSFSAIRRMTDTSTPNNNHNLIEYASIYDGNDDGWTKDMDVVKYMDAVENHGSRTVSDLITTNREKGCPFSRVIYSLLVPWAGQVAQTLQVPSTLLWIQPAALFDIYYYYYKGYLKNHINGSNEIIELPGLLPFEPSDLPSFITSSNNPYDIFLPIIIQNFGQVDKEAKPTVLLNTFDALEPEALKVPEKWRMLAIGPFIPSAFLDGKDPTDKSFGGDLTKKCGDNYIEWLHSKEKSSVIYIAFGSFSNISKTQLDEIARGLINSRRPFLWVIRGSETRDKLDEMLSYVEELEKLGKIVPWCTQVEVLSHPSLGCFVTHCGWNSSLESLVSGVPVVGLPQWTDQGTNGKMLQDYWKTGVKARKNENGIVESDEIARCLEIVMESGEMREKAKKWRELAIDAMKEDGSSNLNLKKFLEDVEGSDKLLA